MDIDKFSEKAGRLEKEINKDGKEIYTFTPNPLPNSINLNHKLLNLLTKATHKLGELSGAGTYLPNPNLLITPYVNREALMSSRIEGTKITISDMYKAQARKNEKKDLDILEVRNYVAALRYGLDNKEKIITINLMRRMHSILLSKNVRGYDKNPGEFRKILNWIGFTDKIDDASFVPPKAGKVPELMQSLEEYINRDNIPPLIQAALAHYQFETIHPFCDGNGRIGRSLITLLLCKKNVMSQPLLYLSAYFEKNRKEYETLLLKVNQEGCYEEWVRFFLFGVENQAEDALKRAKRLHEIREEYREKIQSVTSSNQALRLIDIFFVNPFITISTAMKTLKTTYPTAKRVVINNFLKTGILVEADKKERNRLYCAEDVLRTLEL